MGLEAEGALLLEGGAGRPKPGLLEAPTPVEGGAMGLEAEGALLLEGGAGWPNPGLLERPKPPKPAEGLLL